MLRHGSLVPHSPSLKSTKVFNQSMVQAGPITAHFACAKALLQAFRQPSGASICFASSQDVASPLGQCLTLSLAPERSESRRTSQRALLPSKNDSKCKGMQRCQRADWLTKANLPKPDCLSSTSQRSTACNQDQPTGPCQALC